MSTDRHALRCGASRLMGCFVCCTAAALLCSLPLFAQPGKPGGAPSTSPSAPADPSDFLYRLGFKFNAAATCANATCHGGGDRQRDKDHGWLVRDNSYTLWNRDAAADQPGDPHRTSWRKLKAEPAKQIGQKMGIANPATDARCQRCHALSPPAKLVAGPGALYSDGVTCDACHGPSGESVTLPKSDPAQPGRLVLHLQHGWVAAQRAAFHEKPEAFLKKFGFYDNQDLVARARRCSSCHLAIDGKMVAAGHPQPTFELNWLTQTYDSRHWEDPAENFFVARLWAAGQFAALGDALRQLADRAADPAHHAGEVGAASVKSAYEQAAAHAAVFGKLFTSGAAGAPDKKPQAIVPAVKDLKLLLDAPARRADLTAAARADADATDNLAPAVEAFRPDKDSTRKLLAAILSDPPPGDAGGFGIEQHRDAVFALFDAWAAGGGVDKAKADEDRKWLGEKLFPTDAGGALVPAKALDVARYRSAVAEVKGRLGL